MFRYCTALFGVLLLFACKRDNPDYAASAANPELYHASLKELTDVIVHDIFSPPQASRIYVYASLAGYEAARWKDSTYQSLAGKIAHLETGPAPEQGKPVCYEMASTLAMLKVGKALIFSEDSIQQQIDKMMAVYGDMGIPNDIFTRSIQFSDAVAAHILEWAGKDNYKQTRSFPKYSIQNDPATWRPTPPGYMDGVEPSWNKIRPMLLDSAGQFKPAPPTPFNMTDKNSQYYKEAMEVYTTVKNASPEQVAIANFWDCNPYKLNVVGHVMHATKKISPGGHWINIVGLASRKAKLGFLPSVEAYAFVSVGLFDAFISCWDEKYRSVAVRPETVINEHIDPEWVPLLQTPPFPEYTSGHSVASGATGVILTHLFGEAFSYTDDTEVEFGLEARSYTSFDQAVQEASVSRLYGGIHFMPAIKNGVTEGKAIGQLVLQRMGR